MKQLIVFSALAAALAFPALAGVELQPRDLTPVTRMEAGTHPPVEIVREGRARAVVCVIDLQGREPFVPKRRGQRAPLFKQLVDQLVETVRLATGATLELVDQPPPADQPAIVIGDCAETRQAGIDAGKVPVEGFVVKTTPNRVYLVGSTQGGANDGTAWAGLRLMTELEYEKASRGPIEPGWETGHNLQHNSYWGMHDFNGWKTSSEHPVTVANAAGRRIGAGQVLGGGSEQVSPPVWRAELGFGKGSRRTAISTHFRDATP